MMIIAGDIGGTHTRLGLFERGKLLQEGRFPSRDYPGLVPIVRTFLGSTPRALTHATFGIPGPVRQGRAQATNLPWLVDAAELSRALSIPRVSLLNDLEACGWGIETLLPDDLVCLHKGSERAEGNRALVAAGTGLGEAGLYWDGERHRPFASEGGHADFAPRNALEVELLYALKQEGHVSWERVLSGPGLQRLEKFLVDTGRAKEKAIEWWASLYGAEAGNVALKLCATGGVYVGGGIAPQYGEALRKHFFAAFRDKGRMAPLLESIPVWLIRNDDVALRGAALYAMRRG